jgi:hypothetical protein
MQTKEIPLRDIHYPHRTCGYKNRKKYNKILTKALAHGAYGQFTGFCVIKEIDNNIYPIK